MGYFILVVLELSEMLTGDLENMNPHRRNNPSLCSASLQVRAQTKPSTHLRRRRISLLFLSPDAEKKNSYSCISIKENKT